ncbi:hypothetical protein THAOC_03630, partial [Thalassiosira oceanica]
MESYPCGAQISTINRRRLVVAGVTGDTLSLSATMEPTIGPLSHHGGKGKTAETYARRAQEICAVRDPRSVEATNSDDARPSPVAIIGRLRRPKHASISRVRCRGRVVYGQQGRAAGERAGSRRGSRRRTTGSVSPRGRRSASPGREGTR